jgi:4-amino-4-deoxy-L-arabinose transferase-like glycosyltransferase
VAGVALLAAPFFPLRSLAGGLREESAFVGPGEWVLGLAIFGALAWLAAWTLPGRALERIRAGARALAEKGGRGRTAALLGLLALLLVAASTLAFARRPLLVDAVIQLFQAEIFASGRLTAPAPAEPEFFVTQHMVLDGERWYSQYPPGHAALLALGALLGAAWVVPALLSLAAAFLLHRFAARAYDEPTARVTLVLLLLAPFFWFMGASFMNHVSSLAGVAAFLYAFARWEDEGRTALAAVAGAALGLAFLSRPVETLAIGAVFAGVAAGRAARSRRWLPLAVGGAAFLAVASLYLAFNAATTGHPLRPGYIELWGSAHGLGFHESPWGERHTPAAGLLNQILDLSLLNVFLFEWPIPALLPLGLALAAGWLAGRWDLRLVVALFAVPAANLFYWHRDTFLGPRFLHVTLAFAIPLTARALVVGARRLSGKRIGGGGVPVVDAATWALMALVLSTAYAVAYGVPARFLIYRTGMASMKLDLVEAARDAGIERGLVFVSESWGSRVIAELRGLGAGASAVEKAYRQSDLCDLDSLVRRAESGGWSASRVESALDSVRVGQEALVLAPVGEDPTTRFRPGRRLSAECLDQIEYDAVRYQNFTAQLPDDRPTLDGPLVFARDLRVSNARLLGRYPDRAAWVFRGGQFVPLRERR